MGQTVLEPVGLGQVLEAAEAGYGDTEILHFEGAWSTLGGLRADAARVASGLMRLGAGRGVTLALHAPNGRDWLIAYYGAAMTGAVVVAIDALLAPDEVAFIIKDSGAKILISGLADADGIGAILDQTGVQTLVLTAEAAAVQGGIPLARLVADGEAWFQSAPVKSDDLASISYTSGSTGTPKGAMLSHRNILVSAQLTARIHRRTRDDRVVTALPCTHVYGNAIIHAAFLTGGKLILLRRFDAEAALAAIARHTATLFEGVPTMYFQILAHSRLAKHDLSSLTRCTVGGQSMPIEKMHETERVFGCRLLELWGMTELGGPVTSHAPDAPACLGSIGKALGPMEARIQALEPDAAPGPDLVGELCVRGPLVMQGYLNRPDATSDTIDDEGWLHTGDLARIDDAGHIFISGRKKEVILTAGYTLFPPEVERVMAQHPDVAMVAVGKVPDADRGELAVAYVVLKPGRQPLVGELDSFCRARLAAYKCPRQIHFVADLPKTGSGKVMRHRLQDLVAAPAPRRANGTGQTPTPEYQNIRTEVLEGGIGVVTLHGPKGINALNQPFITEVADALHAFDRNRDIRCMIVRGGTPRYFSVGADITEMEQRGFSEAFDEDFFTAGWARIGQCRKPLIAAVSGLALGGGCEMALMCDIVIASDTAEFGLPEVRLGIFPGAGGTQRLVRQIGKSKAMEIILTGTVTLTAQEALASGLAARVVPVDRLTDTTLDLARKIAANSTVTVRMAKESVNRAYESSLAEGLMFERRLFYASLATRDKAEGTRAFLERRQPVFEDG